MRWPLEHKVSRFSQEYECWSKENFYQGSNPEDVYYKISKKQKGHLPNNVRNIFQHGKYSKNAERIWGFQQRGVFSEILKIILMRKRKLRKKLMETFDRSPFYSTQLCFENEVQDFSANSFLIFSRKYSNKTSNWGGSQTNF